MSDCGQFEENYEAYAIGALEGEERAALEAHLRGGCPRCRAGVDRARWVVAQLAYLAPPQDPPASLRSRVAAIAAEGASPARRDAQSERPAPARRFTVPVWAWVGAALLMLSVYTAVELKSLRDVLAELQREAEAQRVRYAQLEAERKQFETVRAIFSSPESREFTLTAPGQAPVRAAWHPQAGVVLTAARIPIPSPGRAYELWVVPKQGPPIPAGVFRPDAKGQVLHLNVPAASFDQAAALAITEEPAQGSPAPTTKPIWVASTAR